MACNLSIIIINYNTCALLDHCLQSVLAHPAADLEIIVVDNASADDSVNLVKKKYPQIKLIQNEDNLGFAKANNQGFRESRGKYVMYLNSDTLVKLQALEKIIRFMDLHPEVALMGPRLLNEDGSLQISALKLPNVVNSLWDLLLGFFQAPFINKLTSFYDDYHQGRPVGWLSGACVVARREAVERLGGWEENFFMYCEDVLLGVRAHQLGLKVWYFPEAEIVHLRNRSSKIPKQRILQIYASRIKLREFIFSPASYKLYLWYNLLIAYARASAYLTLYLGQGLLRQDSSAAQDKVRIYLGVVKLFISTLSKGKKCPNPA